MQRVPVYIALLLTLVYCSCNQAPAPAEAPPKNAPQKEAAANIAWGVPVKDPLDILKNMDNFLRYSNEHIKLSADFIAQDTTAKIISKAAFLQQLSSGKYLPLQLTSKDTIHYRLYKIITPIDNYIPVLLSSMGESEYKRYRQEGKTLPAFNFTDLEGRVYNPGTTKGKILVLKCWFIKCQRCVEEMPEVNKIVAGYKDRKDILFVSLALDAPDPLKAFLAKTTFDYAVVARQEDYMTKHLGIVEYPTHIVVNKDGAIVKVVSSYQEMEDALKKEASK